MKVTFDIDAHASELLAAGFDAVRVAKFVETAKAGRLRRAFRMLTRPICGARRRHGQGICFSHPLPSGRCSWHGGCSTGPKTVAGRARIAEAQRKRWRQYREAKEYQEIFG